MSSITRYVLVPTSERHDPATGVRRFGLARVGRTPASAARLERVAEVGRLEPARSVRRAA
jgi:hypothetical protein